MQRHKIITRGLTPPGKRHRIVTRGFVVPTFIQPTVENIRVVVRGRSADKRRELDVCDEFTLKVSLIAVNDVELITPITGKLKVECQKEIDITIRASKYVTSEVISIWNRIFIKAKRINPNGNN